MGSERTAQISSRRPCVAWRWTDGVYNRTSNQFVQREFTMVSNYGDAVQRRCLQGTVDQSAAGNSTSCERELLCRLSEVLQDMAAGWTGSLIRVLLVARHIIVDHISLDTRA